MIKNASVFLFVVFLLAPPAAWAQNPPPATNNAPDAPPEPAFLRAWVFPGRGKEKVEVTLRRKPEDAPKVFTSTDNGSRLAGAAYSDLPAGGVILDVRVGDKTVATLNVALRERGYYTFVVWHSGGEWSTKMFPDTLSSPAATDRPLRILNFAEGRSTIVNHGQGQEAKIVGDAIQEIRMPPKINGFSVRVLPPDGGPPAQTSSEIDFTDCSSAYVVVAPDYRGRMRPEILTGGAPKVEVVAVASPTPQLDPAAQAKLERDRVASNRRLERDHMAAQLAILEAQIKEGVNVPENAQRLKGEFQNKLKALQAAPSPTPTAPAN